MSPLDPRRLALLLALAGAVAGRPQDDGALEVGQGFQIYDTQAVRARVESASEHIAASRWSEALVDLQALLEEHWGEVLPAARPKARVGHGVSQQDVHVGAVAWSRETLTHLPAEAKSLYQERYGARADRALAAAIASGDRVGLTAVAMRWPVTEEALRAWWALGDLELELGNESAGLAAWTRALRSELVLLGAPEEELELERPADWNAARERLSALRAAAGQPADPWGASARVAFAAQELAAGRVEGARAPRESTALSPGGDSPRLGRAVDKWPEPHTLMDGPGPSEGEHPFSGRATARYALYPAHLGDELFYSTTRAVFALGAYTGEVLWRTPPDMLSWRSISTGGNVQDSGTFDKAIEFDEALVRPAAAQGVVVAALQIPLAYEREDSYGDLEIIKVVPERRLFAFDARTGELLWDTLPPRGWDGENGTFAERTTIVGSPTVSGSRVLVPAARIRGRIELFVGCFDLHTGEVLWNAPLITGQRPLNMFGRPVREYAAPPVVVEGERVLVATQMGTVACLNLFTGETLWQSLYNQIPIVAGNYYNPGSLKGVWLNAPPAVAGDVVVVAPWDGYDLLGLDLASGAVLWSLSAGEFNRRLGDDLAKVQVLLAADERRVFLGGLKLAVFEAPGGLAREAPLQRDWVYPVSERFRERLPRPVVTRDRIYVSQRSGIEVLDRRNGKLIEEIEDASWGNPLIGDGMVFTLSSYSCNGYFEWDSMLRRARERLAAAPGDPTAVEGLARVLYRRGLSATASSEYRGAARDLADAREVLQSLGSADGAEVHPPLRACLFDVLRAEGRNARLGADPRAAVQSLRRARGLAPNAAALRDTLIEEAEVLRERDPSGWLDALALLLDELPDLPLEVRVVPGPVPGAPWVRLEPLCTSPARALEDPATTLTLPVGLWVLVERVTTGQSDERGSDRGRAFADLHAILQRYPLTPLAGETARAWASQRIAAKLDAGDRVGYEPFAERADALLREALAANDAQRLERVGELYPGSPAAARANDARVDLSLASGDLAAVARIVLDELPPTWRPAQANARDVRNLLRLAARLGEAGNPVLRAAWAASLAAVHGELELDPWPGGKARLADLARAWQDALASEAPPAPSFDATVEGTREFPGPLLFQSLGRLPAPASPAGEPPAADAGAVRLFGQVEGDGWTLYAFSSSAGGSPLWTRSFGDARGSPAERSPLSSELCDSFAASAGRVHVGTRSEVVTLDGATGATEWTWSAARPGVESVVQDSGLVLVRHAPDAPGAEAESEQLTVLDAATGTPLWSRTIDASRIHSRPVVGAGMIVLLPLHPGEARVLDLFSGHETVRLDLPSCGYRTATNAWLQDGRLCLPYFSHDPKRGESPGIRAWDLATGELAWHVQVRGIAGREWDLKEIFAHEGETTLLLSPLKADASAAPGLYPLNVALGAIATRPVAEVPDGRILGTSTARYVLDAPYVFSLEGAGGPEGAYSVRAIHLRFGERWRAPLSDGKFSLQASEMPLPVVSDSTVAIVYVEPDGTAGSRQRRPRLLLLDRQSGARKAVLDLSHTLFSPTATLQLDALGPDLFVCGARMMLWLR